MKTNRLTAILTSAYLSAMLASSVAPIRSDATLAATIDPMAAQKALQTAVNGLNSSGWVAAATTGVPAASVATPQAVSIDPAPKAAPVMTDELWERLIRLVATSEGGSKLDARICKVLDMCDGTAPLMMRAGRSASKDGIHWFAIPAQEGTKDIFIVVKRDTVLEAYLTDKTHKLRAAAVIENGVARLITNEKAAAKYEAELSLFAHDAGFLPPTGTAVAGNS